MKKIYVIKISLLICIMLILLTGCNILDKINSINESYDKNINYTTNIFANMVNGNKVIEDENSIYYINPKDENKIYVINKDGKNKKKISDKIAYKNLYDYNNKIYFLTELKENSEESKLSIGYTTKDGLDYKILKNNKNIVSFIINDEKIYYIANSEEQDLEGFYIYNLYSSDLLGNEEILIEKNINPEYNLILDKSNLYYFVGGFVEYNINNKSKNVLNINNLELYTFLDENKYKIDIKNLEKEIEKMLESHYIRGYNLTEKYIFFISETTKDIPEDKYVLSIFRIKHDGTQLVSICDIDYKNIVTNIINESIYTIGNKLIFIDSSNNIESKNMIKIFDFDGNYIEWDM